MSYRPASSRLAAIRSRQAKRIRASRKFIVGDTAESLGIESVTRMVPNALTLGSTGPAHVAVSLPRVRFLEPRTSAPRGVLPAGTRVSPPQPDLSAGSIPGGQG